MTYFNYHAKAKNLIRTNHILSASIFAEYHHIKPALVLYFDNSRPIPIRDYMWREYLDLLIEQNIPIINMDNIPLG